MGPVDFVIIAVVVVILGLAAWYVHKTKKNGKKCIGCPDGCATQCGGNCAGCSGKCGKEG